VQQALRKIESLGGTTLMPPMDVPGQNITIASFRDPAGVVIGLVKPHTAQPAKDELELVISREIDAPREVAFATWTDAKRLTEWWGPHGMTTPVCEIDLAASGTSRWASSRAGERCSSAWRRASRAAASAPRWQGSYSSGWNR